MTIHIFTITVFELKFVKTIKLYEKVKKHLKRQLEKENKYKEFKDNNQWFMFENANIDKINRINIKIEINDQCDFIACLYMNSSEEHDQDLSPNTIYYYHRSTQDRLEARSLEKSIQAKTT